MVVFSQVIKVHQVPLGSTPGQCQLGTGAWTCRSNPHPQLGHLPESLGSPSVATACHAHPRRRFASAPARFSPKMPERGSPSSGPRASQARDARTTSTVNSLGPEHQPRRPQAVRWRLRGFREHPLSSPPDGPDPMCALQTQHLAQHLVQRGPRTPTGGMHRKGEVGCSNSREKEEDVTFGVTLFANPQPDGGRARSTAGVARKPGGPRFPQKQTVSPAGTQGSLRAAKGQSGCPRGPPMKRLT